MFNFDRWMSTFAAVVGRLREQNGQGVTLLYDSELEAVEGLTEALRACYAEGVKPSVAARRYVALVDA